MITSGGSQRLMHLVRAAVLFGAVGLMGAGEQQECSLATLSGEYLVVGQALPRVDQRDNPAFPRVNVDYWSSDGNGNISTFEIQNRGGQLLRAEETATYTMDSDRCVATVSFPLGATWDVIMARDGSEGEAIRTDGAEGQVPIVTRHLKKR